LNCNELGIVAGSSAPPYQLRLGKPLQREEDKQYDFRWSKQYEFNLCIFAAHKNVLVKQSLANFTTLALRSLAPQTGSEKSPGKCNLAGAPKVINNRGENGRISVRLPAGCVLECTYHLNRVYAALAAAHNASESGAKEPRAIGQKNWATVSWELPKLISATDKCTYVYIAIMQPAISGGLS